jgi:hypothetical protein
MQPNRVWTIIALAGLTAVTVLQPDPALDKRDGDRAGSRFATRQRKIRLFLVTRPLRLFDLASVRRGCSLGPTGALFSGGCIRR